MFFKTLEYIECKKPINKKTKEIKDFITAVKAKTYERHFVTLPASDKKMIQSARYDDLTKSLLLNRENSRANSTLSNTSKKK